MRSNRKDQEQPKLDMTPMIDVVFELMIFFIVTIKQNDIFSRLNANRPAPNSQQTNSQPTDQIKIDIGPGGFVLNGRGMSRKELRTNLKSLSATSRSASVLISCTMDSPHMFLVEALDMCHEFRMENLSIFSM